MITQEAIKRLVRVKKEIAHAKEQLEALKFAESQQESAIIEALQAREKIEEGLGSVGLQRVVGSSRIAWKEEYQVLYNAHVGPYSDRTEEALRAQYPGTAKDVLQVIYKGQVIK